MLTKTGKGWWLAKKITFSPARHSIQVGDNHPLETYSQHTLSAIRTQLGARWCSIEVGVRGLTHRRLTRFIELADYFDARLIRFVIDGEGERTDPGDCHPYTWVWGMYGGFCKYRSALQISGFCFHGRSTGAFRYRELQMEYRCEDLQFISKRPFQNKRVISMALTMGQSSGSKGKMVITLPDRLLILPWIKSWRRYLSKQY